jgi:allantoinase
VHVSSGSGVASAARAGPGVDVSIENVPALPVLHRRGSGSAGRIAKCAPPLREPVEQDALWAAVELARSTSSAPIIHRGAVDEAVRVRVAWGGIAGVQSTLPVLLDRGVHARGCRCRGSSRCWPEPGRAIRNRAQGRAAVGFDADLVLVDVEGLRHCRLTICCSGTRSARTWACVHGVVRRTIRRGETILPGWPRHVGFARPLRQACLAR